MTQDEIIEMAEQAGFEDFVRWFERYPPEVQRWVERMEVFAKLVAAKECEACAKIVQIHYEANDDLRTKGSLASVLDYIKFRGET